MTEIDERIRAALPEGWAAAPAVVVDVNSGEYIMWRVVFERLTLDNAGGNGLRSFTVDALGRTVEDMLTVCRRLQTISEALTLPWPIDLTIETTAT